MGKFKLNNGKQVSRHFYKGVDYDIDYEKKMVNLRPEFHNKLMSKTLWGRFGFKKIGGSSLGSILGSNPFSTKFSESIRLMWLQPPMYDDKYVAAGQAIEPKIVDVIRNMKSGREVKTFNPQEHNFDYFSDNKVIGGLPDAVIDSSDEQITFEIKTTGIKNFDKWCQFGVPKYYQQQVALYDYLLFGKDRPEGAANNPKIVACFLTPEDYANPGEVDIKQRKIKSWEVNYTCEEVQGWIEESKKFRDIVLHFGMSYVWDEDKDRELLDFLECENEEQYEELLKKQGWM